MAKRGKEGKRQCHGPYRQIERFETETETYNKRTMPSSDLAKKMTEKETHNKRTMSF